MVLKKKKKILNNPNLSFNHGALYVAASTHPDPCFCTHLRGLHHDKLYAHGYFTREIGNLRNIYGAKYDTARLTQVSMSVDLDFICWRTALRPPCPSYHKDQYKDHSHICTRGMLYFACSCSQPLDAPLIPPSRLNLSPNSCSSISTVVAVNMKSYTCRVRMNFLLAKVANEFV